MLTAKDVMTKDVISVSEETEISESARLMLENRINGLPVLDGNGVIVGIICQSDLIAQQKQLTIPSFFSFLDGYFPLTSMMQLEKEVKKVAATTVGQAMSPNPVIVGPDTPIMDVATLMVDKNFHTIPVMDNGKLVGILGKEDILKTLVKSK
ncbi:CBS domain-containing protein [Desulfobacterales bacterium HSG16]|nr:CBS domain-containing protein [Desulfobacterales bacterium HSG16]